MTGPDEENRKPHWRQTLTDHDVELIRALHDEGLGVQEIAIKFEVTKATISKIVNFTSRVRSWRVEMGSRRPRGPAGGFQSPPKRG